MAIKQEANVPLIVTVGAVSGILLVVITFGVEAWFLYEENNEIAAKWDQNPNVRLKELREEQTAKITTSAQMPIDQAMKSIVEKHKTAGANSQTDLTSTHGVRRGVLANE